MLKRVGRYPAYCGVTLVLFVFLAGCAGEGNQAILDLVPLQVQLVAEYGASNVVVELQDGNTLGVTFADDVPRGLAPDQRAERAREIAKFVCDNYRSMGRIDEVQVSFESCRNGSLADATGSVTLTFPRSELACGGR